MGLYLIDKTCDKCVHKLTIYYKEMCPACGPIEKKTREYYNLFIVLDRLEVNRPGGKDRVWMWLIDTYDFHNDSFVSIFIPHPSDTEGSLADDFAFIRELLNIADDDEDGLMFEISW